MTVRSLATTMETMGLRKNCVGNFVSNANFLAMKIQLTIDTKRLLELTRSYVIYDRGDIEVKVGQNLSNHC